MNLNRPKLKPNPFEAGTYEHAEFAYTQQVILKSHDEMVEYFKNNNFEKAWEPLLAIAKAGGERWYQRGLAAKDYFSPPSERGSKAVYPVY